MRSIPGARPPVQEGYRCCGWSVRCAISLFELVAERFGEQVMIPVPLPLDGASPQEEIGPLEILQYRLASFPGPASGTHSGVRREPHLRVSRIITLAVALRLALLVTHDRIT